MFPLYSAPHSSPYSALRSCFGAANSPLFDEWSSSLSAVLYVNLLSAACLLFCCLFFFLSLWCRADAVFLRAPAHIVALLASKGPRRGASERGRDSKKIKNKKTHKRHRPLGVRGKQRDSCMTPSFLLDSQLKRKRLLKKSQFLPFFFDGGYYSCINGLNLCHLTLLLSANSTGRSCLGF